VSLSASDLLGLRLRSQLLAPPADRAHAEAGPVERVAAVAAHMLALQAQDPVAGLWAVGARAPGVTRADVLSAYDDGRIIRSWPMRGTIHVVPAEDIGWLQGLTAARVLRGAERRREVLGLSLATLERMRELAVRALAGGRALTRRELLAVFEADGIVLETGWAYHAVWFLCQTGTLVFGPSAGPREWKLVLTDEWIPAPRRLDGDEALTELAARYLAGHGPASAQDLGWWTGLPLTVCRKAYALAADDGRATTVEADGAMWWLSPEVADVGPASLPDLQLLPAFDELLLGYRDRSLSLDAAHVGFFMSSNGIAVPIVTRAGRVVGKWAFEKSGAPGVGVTLFADELGDEPAPGTATAHEIRESPTAAALLRFFA
jgi:hypothetical protein